MLEGVIKFRCDHRDAPLAAGERERARELLAWRRILFDLGLLGQDPQRYGGAGYGNLSARVGAPSSPAGRRPFLITGTQTSDRQGLAHDGLCVVESYDLRLNSVASRGAVGPSSESMTHGAIYDLSARIRWVLHVHSPAIWSSARSLRLPTTAKAVDYGTPEMAREVRRLYQSTPLSDGGVLAMGGHEDGIIAFGASCREASMRLLAVYARALEALE